MDSRHKMWVYAVTLLVVAIGVGVDATVRFPLAKPAPLVALFVLTLVLSNLATELPFAVSLAFTFAPIFAGILYAGPVGGALLGAASAISIQEIREHKPPVLMLVNVAQLLLAGCGAGFVYIALGGQLVQFGGFAPTTLRASLVAPLTAVLAFFILNLLFVGIALSIKMGLGWADTLRTLNPQSYWVSLLVLALLGYVMAQLIALSSWMGLLLLILPFTLARRTFRVYVELSEAFTATVRSLVAAIEAKDPYTRGHSERVAIYARRLAERLHMPRAQVDLTEQAALLHDVGKIGISLRTLTSSEQLRVDEVHQIRRHPVLGAELVEDVEFLSSIVPVIRHHHERPDGTGYPDGLVAAQIPVLARVLAVADCYDAMTSDRAYRVRMTRDEALDEMVRVAGAQLDEDLVSEFREMILADDSAEGGIQ